MRKIKKNANIRIFKNIIENKKTLLIKYDKDILSILELKNNTVTVFDSNNTSDILVGLEKYHDFEFDYVILAVELSKLLSLKDLIPALAQKGNVIFLRIKNKTMFVKNVLTKKEDLLRIFEKTGIKILKTFYTKHGVICDGFISKLFSHYVVYVATKAMDYGVNIDTLLDPA